VADIFFSYADTDLARIMPLVSGLESFGWNVWWDRTLLPGEPWEDKIEAALEATNCVIVAWSKTSIASRWVRTEATEGKRRNILVPILIEDVVPPLAFRDIHTANLTAWSGNTSHPDFQKLIKSVGGLVANNAVPPLPPPWRIRPWMFTIAALTLVSALASMWYFRQFDTTRPLNHEKDKPTSVSPQEAHPASPPASKSPEGAPTSSGQEIARAVATPTSESRETQSLVVLPPDDEPRLLMQNSGFNNFNPPKASGHILFRVKGLISVSSRPKHTLAWYAAAKDENNYVLFTLGPQKATVVEVADGRVASPTTTTRVGKLQANEWLQVDVSVTPGKVSSRIKPTTGDWQDVGSIESDGRDFTQGNAGVLAQPSSPEVWFADLKFAKDLESNDESRPLMRYSGFNSFNTPKTSGHISFNIKGRLGDFPHVNLLAWYAAFKDKNNYVLFILGPQEASVGETRDGKDVYPLTTIPVRNLISEEWLQVDLLVTPDKVSSRIKPRSGDWQDVGSIESHGRDFTQGDAGVLMRTFTPEVWLSELKFVRKE
jgi:hypothetical protein